MKKASIFCVGVLSLFLFISIVAAIEEKGFYFINIGDYIETNSKGYKITTHPKIEIDIETPTADTELGVSLFKKVLFSYSLKEREDVWINGRSTISITRSNYKNGTYKAGLVLNDTRDNKDVKGKFHIENS